MPIVKLVPTYRLIYFVGLVFLPLTLLMVVVPSAAVPNIVLAVASIIVVHIEFSGSWPENDGQMDKVDIGG